MKVFRHIDNLREYLSPFRCDGKSIGLVPTMGALHRGHAVLIRKADSECACVVVSIFVNPLQFGPNEDYSRYPRAFESDAALSEESGAAVIFAPDVNEMYPSEALTTVEVAKVSESLCGPFRPGHFRGVATVVLKLLNIVQPDRAYFGEKDFQQLGVIRRMTTDLNLPTRIVGVETVREPDGLALSSRNAYLTAEQRSVAPVLHRALEEAKGLVDRGEHRVDVVKSAALKLLGSEPSIRIQYLDVVDSETMQPVDTVDRPVRIAAAVWLGTTRLIDNVAPHPLD